MNAVVMDRMELGGECMVGTLAVMKEGMKTPERKLWVGNPEKILKDISDEIINRETERTKLYQQLPGQLHDLLKKSKALWKGPEDRLSQSKNMKHEELENKFSYSVISNRVKNPCFLNNDLPPAIEMISCF